MKLVASILYTLAAFATVARADEDYKLKVTNLSVAQPFGPFFVMVHRTSVSLFELGEAASSALQTLAEAGSPAPLIELYEGMDGVYSVAAVMDGVPFMGGESAYIDVTIPSRRYRVTIASMAINTNDCFVALNGVKVSNGKVYYGPGYDAGTEENNENCDSIPGPACAGIDGANVADGNGEGYVHVHRGFFGIGNDGLAADRYDWRNPMMRVEVIMMTMEDEEEDEDESSSS